MRKTGRKYLKKIDNFLKDKIPFEQYRALVVFVIIFAGIGTYLLFASHALSPTTSTLANSGTEGGCAATQSDNTSSSGYSVLFSGSGCSGIPIGNPFIDPKQLNLKGGQISFYDQPWRGYMETVPASKLLDGIGINYNPVNDPSANNYAVDNANLKYLASIGVHDIRIELPWNAVNPNNETQLNTSSAAKYGAIFAACKQYGITPTILLNANSGGPEPSYKTYSATIVGTPQAGASQITVSGIPASDIAIHQSGTSTGVSGISDDSSGKMAGNLITAVTTNSDGSLTLSLSQPLANPLTGSTNIYYFKYLPLYPVGTTEFNNTMSGWLQYVKDATQTAESAGLTNYSVEIWNELTFGSAFLNINNYYPSTAPLISSVPPSLFSGGSMWELANQTTKYLKSTYGNNVKAIWGFSNTSFYHTPISQLPPSTDGESYHPYGTDYNTLSSYVSGKPREGSYVPNIYLSLPEGANASTLPISATTDLIRGRLNPAVRESSLPTNTTNFLHYITETGDAPSRSSPTWNVSKSANETLKAKAFLREYSFWLNKGLDQFDVYAAFDETPSTASLDAGWNMLAVGSDQSGNPVTPQSQAIGNFTSQFADTTGSGITQSRNLGVSVNDITPNDNTASYQAFPADPTTGEPALNYRDLFQFLPFQVNNNKFVISTYVMSLNIGSPPPPMDFQLNITNVNGNNATVSYYDPITNTSQPATIVSRTPDDIVVNIEAVDYPRTLTINGG